eukprot:6774299-Lingulodinium_polyedra.AAC.1
MSLCLVNAIYARAQTSVQHRATNVARHGARLGEMHVHPARGNDTLCAPCTRCWHTVLQQDPVISASLR